MGTRPYQQWAIDGVRAHWAAGRRRVCLVAPTGSGKTRMGEELIADPEPTAWIAHRRELITQTAERFIHIEPHPRGPEDARTVVRPHVMAGAAE